MAVFDEFQSARQRASRLIDEGNALEDEGRISEALQRYETAMLLSPNLARTHLNHGNILLTIGKPEEALTDYARALILDPEYAAAHYNSGNANARLGRYEAAQEFYLKAICLQPDFVDAVVALGCVQDDLGYHEEAVTSYRRALEIRPDYAEVHGNLGKVLKELGKIDEAIAAYHRALEIAPAYAEAYGGLGIAQMELGQFDAAVENYRRALEIKPHYVEMYNHLGIAQAELGQLDAAVANYRRALEIDPDNADVHGCLGIALLKMGQLSEGWREYEYRWKGRKPPLRPSSYLPQWTGQTPSPGDRLLVFVEQGMGDMLQFSRFLPLASECFSGGVSIVVIGSLLTLFRRSFPTVNVLDAVPADQSAWQWQCPLLSLPLAFRTSLETMPKNVPYLTPDTTCVARWKAKIAALELPAFTRNIGVVWKSGAAMKITQQKSVTLREIASLLNHSGCAWFSLQKEKDPDYITYAHSGNFIDWSEDFLDFNETAALAMNMDLIISVDTSVVHLAGALGLPTWLLNRHASDWRWMLNREDSVWYPTMRIFSQKMTGDWNSVVSMVSKELEVWSQCFDRSMVSELGSDIKSQGRNIQ
jgi:tetratricopeptide (TPR) repeat protein